MKSEKTKSATARPQDETSSRLRQSGLEASFPKLVDGSIQGIDVNAHLREDGYLGLSMSNSGIGTEPADTYRVLVRVGQVDNDLNRKFDGTGL